jgi:hypothetical protein
MTSEETFWNWFHQHEGELENFEADQEKFFDQLAAELHRIDPNLTFEFGPRETKREFVISAGGIKSSFPAVVSLAKAAPSLERWRITAFRPRRSPLNAVEFRGKRVDPENVEFTLLDDGKKAGLYLFIPGLREEDDDYKAIGYLLLDEALGEFDVESRLGLIKMYPISERLDGKRHPLVDLPALFDRLISRLEVRSGLPS